MTWSYTSPDNSDSDMVRFRIGDTDTTDQLLSNEEIAAILAVQSDTTLAAAQCAEALAAKYARKASFGNMSLRVGAERFKQFKGLAATLRSQSSADALAKGAAITVGGRLISEREALASDTSVVQPAFRVNDNDHPGYSALVAEED